MSMKNPLAPAGIELATFRFVAQRLNHCATAVPHKKSTVGARAQRSSSQFGEYRNQFFISKRHITTLPVVKLMQRW